jgi:hypothetical protein
MASLDFLEVACLFYIYVAWHGVAWRTVCNPTVVTQNEKYGYEYYTN